MLNEMTPGWCYFFCGEITQDEIVRDLKSDGCVAWGNLGQDFFPATMSPVSKQSNVTPANVRSYFAQSYMYSAVVVPRGICNNFLYTIYNFHDLRPYQNSDPHSRTEYSLSFSLSHPPGVLPLLLLNVWHVSLKSLQLLGLFNLRVHIFNMYFGLFGTHSSEMTQCTHTSCCCVPCVCVRVRWRVPAPLTFFSFCFHLLSFSFPFLERSDLRNREALVCKKQKNQFLAHIPPKNGLIALWSATNGRVSFF